MCVRSVIMSGWASCCEDVWSGLDEYLVAHWPAWQAFALVLTRVLVQQDSSIFMLLCTGVCAYVRTQLTGRCCF